ncbi:MAG: hypothetical protein GY870_12850, partial [archaeon]|nr:hypothetical protein [archaeon]
NANEIDLIIESLDKKKWELIKEYFEISTNQINAILKTLDNNGGQNGFNLNHQTMALQDLICEKMSILSLEKIKQD